MKVLDIALLDMVRSARSRMALIMMFAAPLLIVGLIYAAFSGLASSNGVVHLPVTRVVVANLDQPDPNTGAAIGQALLDALQADEMRTVLSVSTAVDEASARAAVDQQQADVAVIIPAGLSANASDATTSTAITIYHDPTLTIGPGIVEAVMDGIVDGFSGVKITLDTTGHQLERRRQTLSPEQIAGLVKEYVEFIQAAGGDSGAVATAEFTVRKPVSAAVPTSALATLISPIMVGMLIFFNFNTGAVTAQSIVREDEAGTLARLATTPTPQGTILVGKLLSVVLTVLVQALVLMAAGAVLFGVRWGKPPSAALMILCGTIAASGFGIFLISFVKTSRQAGALIGGVLSVCGIIGGLFTTGLASAPKVLDIIQMLVPQGWALRGWKLTLAGAAPSDILFPCAVLLALGVILFSIGTVLFRRRFA